MSVDALVGLFSLDELRQAVPPTVPVPARPAKARETALSANWQVSMAWYRQRSTRTKVCSRCGVRFWATSEWFGVNCYSLDGLRSECRTCRKPHRPEEIAEISAI